MAKSDDEHFSSCCDAKRSTPCEHHWFAYCNKTKTKKINLKMGTARWRYHGDVDTNLFYAVIQVTRPLERLDSPNEQLSQRLAHSIQFDALWSNRVENHGTVGVVVHQFGCVTKERIGSIQVDLFVAQDETKRRVTKVIRCLAKVYVLYVRYSTWQRERQSKVCWRRESMMVTESPSLANRDTVWISSLRATYE